MKAIDKLENFWKHSRYFFFRPLLVAFTKLKINANYLSFLGLISAAIMFYFLISTSKMYGVIFFALFILFDSLDGSLARHQKKESDKGKFLDMVIDSVGATLLVLALLLKQTINPFSGSIFVYLMLFTIALSIIADKNNHKSKWIFRSRAGFIAQLPKNVFFVSFVLWAFGIVNVLNSVVFLSNVYLTIVGLGYFIIIWRHY